MSQVKFYSEQEQKELLKIAKDSNANIYNEATRFAKKYNRSINAVEVQIYKMRRILYPENVKKVSFYTVEQVNEMVSILKTQEIDISELSDELANKYKKTAYSVRCKLYNLSKTLNIKPNIKQNVKALALSPNARFKKPLENNSKPIVEQQPADIGVDVPHGMTFEGKPKRITLHSDHFRIYF